jgi:hypothetical protein
VVTTSAASAAPTTDIAAATAATNPFDLHVEAGEWADATDAEWIPVLTVPPVAGGVIADGALELVGHQRRVDGGREEVPQHRAEDIRWFSVEDQAGPDPAGDGQQVRRAELVLEAAVAAQDDRDDRAGVELGRAEEAQLGEQRGRHLLRLVDEQHGAEQRLVDVLLPLRAHGLVRAPPVRRRDRHAEQVAELPVEVGDAALRAGHLADDDVAQGRELLGQQAQRGALAGADVAGDEREAAVHDEVLDAPCEVLDAGGLAQRLDGDVLEERVPLEAVQRGQLACIHQVTSLGTYAGGSPEASYEVMSWRSSGAISGIFAGGAKVAAGGATSASRRRDCVPFLVRSSG